MNIHIATVVLVSNREGVSRESIRHGCCVIGLFTATSAAPLSPALSRRVHDDATPLLTDELNAESFVIDSCDKEPQRGS
jgi:hypothetical protein